VKIKSCLALVLFVLVVLAGSSRRVSAQTTVYYVVDEFEDDNGECYGSFFTGTGCSTESCDAAWGLAMQDARSQLTGSCRSDELVEVGGYSCTNTCE
jgi:hypothetical protein